VHKFLRKRVKLLFKCAGFQSKVQIFAPNAQVYFENVRKRSKTFENIRKYSKNGAKRLKIFENIQIFCTPLRK